MFEAQVLQVQEYWCELIWHQHSSEQIKKKEFKLWKQEKKKKADKFFQDLIIKSLHEWREYRFLLSLQRSFTQWT